MTINAVLSGCDFFKGHDVGNHEPTFSSHFRAKKVNMQTLYNVSTIVMLGFFVDLNVYEYFSLKTETAKQSLKLRYCCT